MIYLRQLAASHRLDEVRSVELIGGDEAWIRPQVAAELQELFPGVGFESRHDEADLLVVADRKEQIVHRVKSDRAVRRSPVPVWLYAVDLGRVELLPSGAAAPRWLRQQRLRGRIEKWSRAHPGRWRTLGDAAHLSQQWWWKLGLPMAVKAKGAMTRAR